MTRDDIQDQAVEYIQKYDGLVLEWATGCGKSYAALKCMFSVPGSRWLFLCKERSHIANWKREYLKWAGDKVYFTDFACYHSAEKFADIEYTGIILDECHGSTTPKRVRAIRNITRKYTIALSATIDKQVKAEMRKYLPKKTKWFKFTLDEAITHGILPKPEIQVCLLKLDTEKPYLKHLVKKGRENLVKNEHRLTIPYEQLAETQLKLSGVKHYRIVVSVTEQQKYDMLTEDMRVLEPKQHIAEFFKYQYLAVASARKRFLAECKAPYIVSLLQQNADLRTIAFTGSKLQSENVAQVIPGSEVINSDYKQKIISEKINQFNAGDISKLISVKIGRESLNLVDIECAIIGQLDSKQLSFIQMLGRSLRARRPKCFILVYENTQDAKYASRALATVQEDWYEINREFQKSDGTLVLEL